ncbi:MAG: DUF3108 domain-containing protein [Mariprofundales bacterium]|nr:DUF3108 domain-containing protein [Mariprofundales bacterium]
MFGWGVALLLLAGLSPSYAATCMPFAGEQLTFAVNWEFINGGSAVISYRDGDTDGYRMITTARTNKLLDIFKKVRDIITSEAVCIKGQAQSVSFTLDQHERHYRAHKETKFRWREGKVDYTQNHKTDTYSVSAGHLSVMDAFTRVRQLPLTRGSTIRLPVFDSRKSYLVVVTVGKKTTRLKAPWGGVVECIAVTPHLKTAGIFSSRGTMTIWMTNDARHIPLKMRAKIRIGHIVAYLTDYTPPAPDAKGVMRRSVHDQQQ